MSMFFNQLSHAFGLDIGDRSFKFVQVARRRSKVSPFHLTAWGSVDVPEGVMDNGTIVDLDAAVALLKQLFKHTNGRLHGKTAVASLPEAKTFVKVISLPASVHEDALKQAVVDEVQQNIPLPLEEIYYDWQVVPKDAATPPAAETAPAAEAPAAGTDSAAVPAAPEAAPVEAPAEPTPPPMPKEEKQTVLIAAAPRELADRYTALLEGAGLLPAALEIESMAVTRAIVPDMRMTDVQLGILDIGATRSSLIIYDANSVQMSIGIPISGNQITDVVSEKLGVPTEEAEALKIQCGLDVKLCEDRLWNILLPFIDEMSERIRNALRFYRIGFESGIRIDRVYLCGGGAYFKEIDAVLSRKLGIKVRRGNALVNLNPKLPKGFPGDGALGYTTAIGLALRAIMETTMRNKGA